MQGTLQVPKRWDMYGHSSTYGRLSVLESPRHNRAARASALMYKCCPNQVSLCCTYVSFSQCPHPEESSTS